jgi:hypothetical protein
VLNVLLIFPSFITILGKSYAVFVVDSHGVPLQGVASVFVVFVLDTEALALVFLLTFDCPVSFCTPVLHIQLSSGATTLRPYEDEFLLLVSLVLLIFCNCDQFKCNILPFV